MRGGVYCRRIDGPILILPSPLLGPTSYGPLAAELERNGYECVVAAVPEHILAADHVLAAFSGLAFRVLPRLVVAHSNAGHYAPTVARDSGAEGVVFMDAALPVESGSGPMVPERFAGFLADLADDQGWLPPWTRWWPRDDIEALFPSPEWFDRVDAACPTAHVSYFDSGPEPPERWFEGQHSHIAFGDTYQEETIRAHAYGWPTSVMDGQHLHYLKEPTRVAEQIVAT